MIDRELLARCAAPYEVEITDVLYARLDTYARLLVEWALYRTAGHCVIDNCAIDSLTCRSVH